MRTFAGTGLAPAAEGAAADALATARRLRTRRQSRENPVFGTSSGPVGPSLKSWGKRALERASERNPDRAPHQTRDHDNQGSEKRAAKAPKRPIPDHLSTVLEIEPVDAVLPSASPPPPIPRELLTALRSDPLLGLADVRLIQHLQRTGAGLPPRSQAGGSYQGLNQDIARRLGTEPVPAARLTWLALRLELPGSRRRELAARAAGPILARGGGITGARRTLDTATRTAAAKLALAGYRTITLDDGDHGPDFGSYLAETHEPCESRASRGTGAGEEAELTAAAAGGVLIGVDPAHRPVTLGSFRRTTLSTALVGSLYLAQILALRCAAVGARVIVETGRPDEWDPVLLHSGLDGSRLAIQPVGRPVGHPGWPAPTPANPLLVLRDCGARPPYAAMPHGPWTSIVTLLPYFDPRTAGYLRDADLVGMQRMPREEAAMARHLLSLPDKDTAALADLPGPMVLWRSRKRTMRYCEVAPTSWEHGLLGEQER